MGSKKFWILLACILAGSVAMQYRTYRVAAPVLHEAVTSDLRGVVMDVEQAGKNFSLILAELDIEELADDVTPEIINILVLNKYNDELQPGDRILVTRARLFPNEPSATPGGYDARFFNWFKQIGATGYTPYRPIPEIDSYTGGFRIYANQLRTRLAWQIDASDLTETNSQLVKAILLGYRKDLQNSEVRNNMRLAGLGHILAISGLHMALCAGIVFALLRGLLALSPFLALHYNLKKIAVPGAFLAVSLYFYLSGFAISAQRAFVMIIFLFIAILVDRPVVFLRALMLTALTILLWQPEQLFTAGFQMSFLAVAAINRINNLRRSTYAERTIPAVPRYLLSSIAICFAASLVTSLVSFQLFNYLNLYNFLANVVALPLLGLIVLPLILALGLALPLGYAALLIPPLELSLDFVSWLAELVANLPYSYLEVSSIEGYYWGLGIILVSAGLVYQSKSGLTLATAAALFLLLGATQTTPTDIYLTANSVAIRTSANELFVLPSKRCAKKFTRQQWAKPTGARIISARQAGAVCDQQGCTYQNEQFSLKIAKETNRNCGQLTLTFTEPSGQSTLTFQPETGSPVFLYLNHGKFQVITSPRTRLWHGKQPEQKRTN